jgi:hypothetical protein
MTKKWIFTKIVPLGFSLCVISSSGEDKQNLTRMVGVWPALLGRGLACAIAFRDANPAVSPSSIPPGRISSGKSRCLTRPHAAVRHRSRFSPSIGGAGIGFIAEGSVDSS